jgi:ABC-type antimicrobial peptide transport system permease subunit
LATIIIIEMIFMGLIGVISGILLSSPIIYLLNKNPIRLTGNMAKVMEDMGFDPIMPLAWFDSYILWQGIVVALMLIFACILPLRKVYKLKEVEALRA